MDQAARAGAGRLVRPGRAAAALLVVVTAGGLASGMAVGRVAPGAPRPTPPALSDRPNLLLVMVDTLRADHLSCYGGPLETPSLCSLAEDGGTIFDGFAHASWTKPSAASVLTSLLPTSHGAMSKPAVLRDELLLLSEVLKERGYATGGIVSNINLAPSFGFAQGYDEYHYLGPDYLAGAEESSSKLILYNLFRAVWFKINRGYRVGDFYQDSETVNRVAFDFLERHRSSRFFLFLHFMDPHDPYFAHPYDGSAVARVANPHPDPELAGRMQQLYRGEIEFLDRNFGALLDRMRELSLYDDTVIALVSDHGEEFHEHGGWWHGLTLYDEQIRVPLLVKWARGDAPVSGDATGHVARLIDVAPTLIARAGATPPEAMAGIDLAQPPARRDERDRMAFAEEDHEGNVLRALRTRDWKLIEANPGNPRRLPEQELFDLTSDRAEQRNVVGDRQSVATELRLHLDAQEQLARRQAAGDGEAARLSQSQEDALRALGYME